MSSGAAEPVKRHRCVMFTCSSAGKESACNVGGLASIPGSGRSPGEGKGYPLQYSGLENTTDCIVHGVAKGQTRLSTVTVIIVIFKYVPRKFLVLPHIYKKSNS